MRLGTGNLCRPIFRKYDYSLLNTKLMIDHTAEMREHARKYSEVEEDLKAANPTLVDSDTENYSDSYKWLRLPLDAAWQCNPEDMILSGVEELPNDCLAGILLEVLENELPKGIDLSGMSIDRTGNSFRFYISGSTSLDELRTLYEQRLLHVGQKS